MAPTGNHQDSRARAEEAFRLRAVGRTWAEISRSLGYRSRGAAQAAVKRLMDRTPAESPGQARARADESLRITQSVLFGRLASAVQRGDDDVVSSMAKEIRATVAERSKLVGAYAPQRTEVDVQVTQTPTALIDRLESELLALVAQQQPQQPAALGGGVIDVEAEEVPR
ncbi:Uncharacterised protein [Mycobacteroides abscessus subsp. bolletii]|uniref:hypothetical protein n=1 Tax=Mycobacteroides abscessus TaxID=36809 RepID=UPI000926457A|nr:hypothetical protein [Mycobacteroides abscessus]SIJ61623.1 Uncharacterised protein [Mycobacteroides abscessus subsp. bolletii]